MPFLFFWMRRIVFIDQQFEFGCGFMKVWKSFISGCPCLPSWWVTCNIHNPLYHLGRTCCDMCNHLSSFSRIFFGVIWTWTPVWRLLESAPVFLWPDRVFVYETAILSCTNWCEIPIYLFCRFFVYKTSPGKAPQSFLLFFVNFCGFLWYVHSTWCWKEILSVVYCSFLIENDRK